MGPLSRSDLKNTREIMFKIIPAQKLAHVYVQPLAIKVGINPILSDLNSPKTSKLGWRYFKANKIDGNELLHRNRTVACKMSYAYFSLYIRSKLAGAFEIKYTFFCIL